VASKELDEDEIALNEHGIAIARERQPGGSRTRLLRLTNSAPRDAGRAGTGADEDNDPIGRALRM
jgi:hypothetical protein